MQDKKREENNYLNSERLLRHIYNPSSEDLNQPKNLRTNIQGQELSKNKCIRKSMRDFGP
jgi:hypothetical protein